VSAAEERAQCHFGCNRIRRILGLAAIVIVPPVVKMKLPARRTKKLQDTAGVSELQRRITPRVLYRTQELPRERTIQRTAIGALALTFKNELHLDALAVSDLAIDVQAKDVADYKVTSFTNCHAELSLV
jgi:hypothetical protein